MAGNYEDILIKVDLDESGFDKGIRNINSNLKTMNAEMKRTNQAMKFDDSSMESVDNHLKAIKKTAELYRQKLDAINKELDEMKNAGAVDDKKFARLQKEAVDCKTKLEKLNHEAGELDAKKIDMRASLSGNAENEIQEVKQKANSLNGKVFSFKVVGEGFEKIKAQLNSVGTSLRETGSKVRGMASNFSGVSLAVGGALGASIKLASDLNETMSKTDVVFGKSSAEVKKFADSTLKNFGIARGTALEMASGFGDMATSMGISQKEASKMSTSLVALAGDTASFKNERIDVVETALTGIFSGETESLKRLGVVMTDTNVQTYALSNGFKGNWKEASQSEKVMWRYKYVMDALGNSQGDFKRTFASTANQTRILGESLKELGERMGQLLLPIITPIIAKFSEFVQWLASLDEGIQRVIIVVASLIAGIAPLGILLGGIISGFGVFAQVLAFLMSPIGLVIGAVVALIAGLSQLSAEQIGLTGNTNALVAIWNQVLVPAFQTLGDIIKTVILPALSDMWKWFQENILPILVQFAQFIFNSVIPALVNMWNWFQANILPILQQLWDMFVTNILPIFQQFADFIMNKVVPAVMDMWNWFQTKILPVLQDAWKMIMEKLIPIFQNFWNNIQNLIGIVSTLWGWFADNLLPILIDLWQWIAENIIPIFASFVGAILDVINWVTDIHSKITGFINDALKKLDDILGDVGKAFGSAGKAISGFGGWIDKTWGKVTGFFGDVAKGIAEFGDWLGIGAGGFGADFNVNHALVNGYSGATYGMEASGFQPATFNTTINIKNSGAQLGQQQIETVTRQMFEQVDVYLYNESRRRR